MEYVKANPLAANVIGGEDRIQEIIANDPSVLGLSKNLKCIQREKPLPGGGRLDILLEEPGAKTRYAVELQLGDTDPSHIIRTIEYWDLLERTNPSHDHVAVLVAEGLTRRFFNVIRLFNQKIPLIAVQMSCIEVDGKATVAFTKVLDLSPEQSGLDEETSNGEANERGWKNYAGPKIMQLLDSIFGIAKEFDPNLRLHYTQSYIAINRGMSRKLTAIFWPQKKQIKVGLYVAESPQMETLFRNAGVDAAIDSSWGMYSFAISPEDFEGRRDFLKGLMEHLYSERHVE